MLLWSNLGVKPTWLFGKTGNSAFQADHRIPPNQKDGKVFAGVSGGGERGTVFQHKKNLSFDHFCGMINK